MIKIIIEDPQLAEQVKQGGELLRDLCQKEVDIFNSYVQRYGTEQDPQYRDGLARFERLVLEGYLYQKIRGHVDDLKNLPAPPG